MKKKILKLPIPEIMCKYDLLSLFLYVSTYFYASNFEIQLRF